MEITSKLKSLKGLTFLKVENSNWVYCEELASFLRNNRQENESPVQINNLIRDLKTYRPGISVLNNKKIVSASVVIKYLLKLSEKLAICNTFLDEITTLVFANTKQDEDASGHLDLYTKIANSDLWYQGQLSGVSIKDCSTLYRDYKDRFSSSEWQKICYFEYHFEKGHTSNLKYDEEIREKHLFFKSILIAQTLANDSKKKCEDTIISNTQRKAAADALHGQNCIHNETRHSYVMLDRSLNECLDKYANVCGECVCITCNNLCNHMGDVHVIVELKKYDNESLMDIADLLATELHSLHGLKSTQYIFVKDGTLEKYRCKLCDKGETHRFHIHRDLYYKQQDFVVGGAVTLLQDCKDPEILEQVPDLKLCSTCFCNTVPSINDTLDWRSLDIMSEWIHHVPIEVQLFFYNWFINKNSLRRSLDQTAYLKGKITRLYGIFDSGLSLLNRKYSGIIQQLNSEELLINYHSLSTVFDITSNFGCTQSLRSADRWLRMASDASVSYYETYIKRYPLVYQSDNETEASTHHVSIKDCHVVFFMDNLVRMSTHTDPDPGMGRTTSVCTLPITLKGLPRDSKLVESWHLGECTDSSTGCKCMNPVSLDKTDFKLLIECTSAETQAWNRFKQQSTWGLLKEYTLHGSLSEVLQLPTDEENGVIKEKNVQEEKEESEENVTYQHKYSQNVNDINILESVFIESMNLDNTIDENQFLEGLYSMSDPNLHSTIVEGNHPEEDDSNLLPEFLVPPLLCRHPIPATGRDDCKSNIKQVLDETLLNLDRHPSQKDRIIFAPDHKISQNVIRLKKENKKYEQFLLEFPALHLRKSKINNLFAAYEKAGLNHMLQFMKDSEQEADWRKLLTLQNIETATRNVLRLSLALHLALFVKFLNSLSKQESCSLIADLHQSSSAKLSYDWDQRFRKFCTKGCASNATFALHQDILNHCDEIVAISIAERIGGPSGYNLLLASVKKSLPFAFVNGSSSYAAFCVELLHEHYRAGHFHRNLKMCLFSTPHKESRINIALDTQREIDHRDAIKAFRPRSTLESVVPRMTVVDHFMEVHRVRTELFRPYKGDNDECNETTDEIMNWTPKQKSINEKLENKHVQVKLSEKDWKHSLPLFKMLNRQQAFSIEDCLIPENIYASNDNNNTLSCEILDSNSYSVGQFLIRKYAASNGLFGLELNDIPDIQCVDGPRNLVRKAFGKSTTLRRVSNNPTSSKNITFIDHTERKRQAKVRKQTKVYNCLSSEMNTCQALLNPDGSKPPVQKANGIKKALRTAIQTLNTSETRISEKAFIKEGIDDIPLDIRSSITHATIEFAGIKFRTKAASGDEYIQHIQNGILKKTLDNFSNINCIVVCEEKYSFTPDDFKFATRQKRNTKGSVSIAHLKSGDEILSDRKMSKSAVIGTTEGKKMISNYLARNLTKLDIKRNLKLVIDSELFLECNTRCGTSDVCDHDRYALPVQCDFNKEGFLKQEILKICQRKGEAEMSQVDWLSIIEPELNQDCAAMSIVSSGDIDSVLIHMVTLSLHWPRFENGSFKKQVYVMLQKVKPDIYCITDLIIFFERMMGFRLAGMYVAIVCLMGGNDFIPRYHDKTHEKWIAVFLRDISLLKSLIKINERDEHGMPTRMEIDEAVYMEAIKLLYAGKIANSAEFTLEEVRQISIKIPGRDFKVPTQWMPPYSAIRAMVQLLNLQIEYLLTAWYHDAALPVFLGKGCLIKDCETGFVKYDFGEDTRVSDVSELIHINEDILAKKMNIRLANPKRNSDSRTPQKDETDSKRRAQRSTPRKMRRPKCSKSLQLQPSEEK